MSKIFFTSDHHFGHTNIIKFCNRPFNSVDEMDNELIKKWNEKISKEDEVYHLGDFALSSNERFKEIADQLNGTSSFINGN